MMRQAWRWFGPKDPVTLAMARQAGAHGIVTALDDIPTGMAWDKERIRKRQQEVKDAGMEWQVVESLAVTEDIKLRTGKWREDIGNYVKSMRNLAECGIKVVCYNFMPIIDWTRTDIAFPLPNGGTAMRFDLVSFALFDIHILRRAGAEDDYPEDVVEQAGRKANDFDEKESERLVHNLISGLPGSSESWDLDKVRRQLGLYDGVDSDALRSNFVAWLEEVVPEAERAGILLCCHPDDPPFPLLGLPRIMSTEEHYRKVVEAVPSRSNGITFCSGSLGARPDNDLPGFVARLGQHIHFAHLRNVSRDSEQVPCSFTEDEHLSGMTDMVAVIGALLEEQGQRRKQGREDWQIPMRPDHGQDILDDLGRDSFPGYPAIGRLKGLAEIRGVMSALAR